MKKAWKILILFGLVSLLADTTYEGARSIIPSFLYYLGATATLTGLILGVAEFIAYVMRLPAGYISDKSGDYWTLTIAGYIINLFAVPLLALANSWQIALMLLVVERFGKAIRTPAREVLLSGLKRDIPTGKIFGFHEFMDQLGAMLGPLIAFLILWIDKFDYRTIFMVFAIPALLALFSLLLAYRFYDPAFLEYSKKTGDSGNEGELDKRYWVYVLSTFLAIVGLLPYSIVLYVADKQVIFADWFIPVIYFIIMGVDGIVALIAGYAYEKVGLIINVLIPIAGMIIPFFFIKFTSLSFMVVSILLGVALGTFESVTRGAITDIVKISKRGLGYGAFYTSIGIAFTISGYVYGYLYDMSLYNLTIIYGIALEIIALLLFYYTHRLSRSRS